MDPQTTLFQQHRPRLFGLAYRMLGTPADAEDVLHDAWLRWHAQDTTTLDDPEAWLVTVTTRLALDRLRRAQQRLLQRFVTAMQQPTLASLQALFAEDAIHISDGGGVVSAALRPLHGAERLARLYLQVANGSREHPPHFHLAHLNGAPALLWEVDGTITTAMWIECEDGRITAIHALRHPDKLAYLQTVTKWQARTSLH